MVKKTYGVTGKPITVRNPQANAIVERVHQTIGNIIRTFELEDNYLDEEEKDFVVMTESTLGDAETTIAFKPRTEFPKYFKFFRLFKDWRLELLRRKKILINIKTPFYFFWI